MPRLPLIVVLLTFLAIIVCFWFFWILLPERLAIGGTTLNFDVYNLGLAVAALLLSIGVGLANFLYSHWQQRTLQIPSIHINPEFRPSRPMDAVLEKTHNQFWLQVLNLHSTTAPMSLFFVIKLRTVDKASRSGWLRWNPDRTSQWKIYKKTLPYLLPNEPIAIEVLLNLEMTVETLVPKLLREIPRAGYISYEPVAAPIYVEIMVECHFRLSIPGMGKQQITPVHFFCTPTSQDPIVWVVYQDREQKSPLSAKHEKESG